jgi:hypothetical protein
LVAITASVTGACVALSLAGSALADIGVVVRATTVPVANSPASQTPSTATCPTGTVLSSGGARVYFGGTIDPADPYHPINGLIVRGVGPSDSDATPSANGAGDPSSWTVFGGFAGQSELGDVATTFALCTTGGPAHTAVVTSTISGPIPVSSTAQTTATCPTGTTLVGGGAMTNPPTSASLKPVGSYPSDASGSTSVTADPDSWTAVGESGGRMEPSNTTTAFAVCSTSTAFHTVVVRKDVIDHPAGPGNSNPGSDAVATTTATCPAGTSLIAGGALASGSAPGADGGELQQGVHLRGSYPSDAAGTALGDGATAPGSWTSIVQSGGQATPGTDTFAFALCAQQPAPSTGTAPPAAPGGATSGAAGTTTASPATPNSTAAATTSVLSRSATATPGASGSVSVGAGAAQVVLRWRAHGLAASRVRVTAGLQTKGVVGGTVALELSVAKFGGGAVTGFVAPLDIGFAGAAGNLKAAYETKGEWIAVPPLQSAALPAGYREGWYRDSLGGLHVLTDHPGRFALLAATTKTDRVLRLGYAFQPLAAASSVLTFRVQASTAARLEVTLGKARQEQPIGVTPTTLTLAVPAGVRHALRVVLAATSGSLRVTHVVAVRVAGASRT